MWIPTARRFAAFTFLGGIRVERVATIAFIAIFGSGKRVVTVCTKLGTVL
jgi:hypothetical protein